MTESQSPQPRRVARSLLVLAVVGALSLVGIVAAPSSSASGKFDATVDQTIADIQSYWAKTMPAVYGKAYDPIPSDRLHPYSASNPPPACGGHGTTPYQQVAGNAFYCSQGDFVAWDAQGLLPKLTKQFGNMATALVLAHEWGHAIQARVGFDTSQTVYLEQQADCFAGAWTAHVAHGDSSLSMDDTDLNNALAGFLQLRDPSGTDGSQDGAHGNGFDRVRAFQDGFEGGAKKCAGYEDNPPPVTESAYTSEADYLDGGNMSLADVLPAVQSALESYYSTSAPKVVAYDSGNAPACDGGTDGGVLVDSVTYCPSTNTIAYDRSEMLKAHDDIGDFASGVLLAAEWSSSVQHDKGQAIGTAAARDTADCLAGSFTSSLDPDNQSSSSTQISLSPGDLDEVVRMLVAADSNGGDRGTAFSRVAAFRTGYFQGADACKA
ncbi:MAG TPA: neutral zinc metallopeptidase [Acidimicrobiia bacterium]|nr:neutral zinc metallopeptidase [Acidimicrobiia bacterium]